MKDLTGLLELMKMTHQFRTIERVIHMIDSDRLENDMEHSFQLALCGWYVITTDKLSLDVNKVIKYALLHDLVEVYAGDTPAHDPDPEIHASKKQREHDALITLREKFSEFPDMTETIEEYEKRQDEESKFVYALDKVLSSLNIYLSGGRSWKVHNISLAQVIAYKEDKVKVSPAVEEYFNEMKALLEKEKETLFPES